jgi:hypothetical protein
MTFLKKTPMQDKRCRDNPTAIFASNKGGRVPIEASWSLNGLSPKLVLVGTRSPRSSTTKKKQGGWSFAPSEEEAEPGTTPRGWGVDNGGDKGSFASEDGQFVGQGWRRGLMGHTVTPARNSIGLSPALGQDVMFERADLEMMLLKLEDPDVKIDWFFKMVWSTAKLNWLFKEKEFAQAVAEKLLATRQHSLYSKAIDALDCCLGGPSFGDPELLRLREHASELLWNAKLAFRSPASASNRI